MISWQKKVPPLSHFDSQGQTRRAQAEAHPNRDARGGVLAVADALKPNLLSVRGAGAAAEAGAGAGAGAEKKKQEQEHKQQKQEQQQQQE